MGAALINTAIGRAFAGGIAAYIKKRPKEAAKLFSKTALTKFKVVGLGALAATIVPAINCISNGIYL